MSEAVSEILGAFKERFDSMSKTLPPGKMALVDQSLAHLKTQMAKEGMDWRNDEHIKVFVLTIASVCAIGSGLYAKDIPDPTTCALVPFSLIASIENERLES